MKEREMKMLEMFEKMKQEHEKLIFSEIEKVRKDYEIQQNRRNRKTDD